MLTISDIVSVAKTNSIKRSDMPGDQWVPTIRHASSCSDTGVDTEGLNATVGAACPTDLREFWHLTRSAKFFQDITHNNWGLEIFSPEKAIESSRAFQSERPRDWVYGDLIIGQLIGDSDLLIVRCDKTNTDYGKVVLAGVIDPRGDWDIIADSFHDFLQSYVEGQGEMYWVHKS